MQESRTSIKGGCTLLQKEIEKAVERVYNYPILIKVRLMKVKAKNRRTGDRRARLVIWGIMLSVLAVFGVTTIGGIQLKQKNRSYQAREEALQEAIAEEEARAAEIEKFEAYTQTKKYVEEVAKDKLGLVYEDEIIFKASDK